MTYVTVQGLIDRGWATQLVQLTDKVNKPATTIDEAVVSKHIDDAASTIDSYLGKKFALPLTAVPAVLEKVAADLAIYFLHGQAAGKDTPIDRAYRDALRWLENVSKGLITIEGAGTIEANAPAGGGQVLAKGPERIFSRDRLGDL